MKFGNGKINFDTATELTIAADAITITQGNHKLQPQTGTTDDLSTINGTVAGDFGILYASDFGTDTITIKHNVGNILCIGAVDIALSYGAVAWYSNGTKIFMTTTGAGAGSGDALVANPLSQFAATTSAQLAGVISDDLFALSDIELGAIAGLTSAANKFPYFTGSGTAALADLSAAMRTFLTTPTTANFAALVSDIAASDTKAGHIEIATIAEINTGTDATRAISPDGLAGSNLGTKSISVQVIAGATTLTTGDGKAYLRVPAALTGMNIVGIAAQVITTSSSGTPTVQVARGRQASPTTNFSYSDVLSTLCTIDATEYDSKDATTAAVINGANDDLVTGDVLRIDVDVAGTDTAGLNVTIECRLP